ncbi:MAG: CRISPR-associated helicase Cas3' [Lactimicrobium massiliense]|nr:CRISPR-associated helicase Cas3' [Lactimicrobium massiliense]MDD6559973.1 CRISPR-associated helicase Cas3' [Lactimicrobium massiliense]
MSFNTIDIVSANIDKYVLLLPENEHNIQLRLYNLLKKVKFNMTEFNNDKYIAHINSSGEVQTIKEHCKNVAELSSLFAHSLNLSGLAYTSGLLHDIGKYSDAFQRHIRGDFNRVDHSSAGAQEINHLEGGGILKVMSESVIAGHHSGLLNIGSEHAHQEGTLSFRLHKKLENYLAYKTEIQLGSLKRERFAITNNQYTYLAVSFMTRMLFSCLVDADFLDTEDFMEPGKRKTKYESISVINGRLLKWLDNKGWRKGTIGLAGARSSILNTCIEAGNRSKGLYTLTVPTGGGKTVSSLAFALQHAVKNQMDRVIYVIPYCSIIDQTVRTFNDILGSQNVLAHYSEADYNDSTDDEMVAKRLSAENWDMPIIVTTAVQFFESLYSNKTSKCRKLHNIANSVIIFDEAQTLPISYLDPCIAAISALVDNCGSTCVLCTATQPSLEEQFKEFDPKIRIDEICPNAFDYREAFQRVKYMYIGPKEDGEIADLLQKQQQALCIVSTVRQAYNLYQRMQEQDGIYCMSTNILPEDRMHTLEIVKERIQENKRCILIATSMVEAGVDIDFPVVYKSYAGIDSMIQAGGRCNREGKRPLDESVVYLFEPDKKYRMPADMLRPKQEAEPYKDQDITDPAIEKQYFMELFRDSNLDEKNIVDLLNKKDTEYETVSDSFHLIENNTWTLYIGINDQSIDLLNRLQNQQFLNREEYRILGKYALQLYETRINKFADAIAVIDPDNKIAVLANTELYSRDSGLSFANHEGEMIML